MFLLVLLSLLMLMIKFCSPLIVVVLFFEEHEILKVKSYYVISDINLIRLNHILINPQERSWNPIGVGKDVLQEKQKSNRNLQSTLQLPT